MAWIGLYKYGMVSHWFYDRSRREPPKEEGGPILFKTSCMGLLWISLMASVVSHVVFQATLKVFVFFSSLFYVRVRNAILLFLVFIFYDYFFF